MMRLVLLPMSGVARLWCTVADARDTNSENWEGCDRFEDHRMVVREHLLFPNGPRQALGKKGARIGSPRHWDRQGGSGELEDVSWMPGKEGGVLSIDRWRCRGSKHDQIEGMAAILESVENIARR